MHHVCFWLFGSDNNPDALLCLKSENIVSPLALMGFFCVVDCVDSTHFFTHGNFLRNL